MNNKVIPKGCYCYDKNSTCPYFTYLQFRDEEGDILIPYCAVIQTGSLGGNLTDSEFDRLSKLLGYENYDLVDDEDLFGSDLLWDQVKECGINTNY